MGLIDNVLQVGNEVRTVFGRHYPKFVYGGEFSKDEVPVFVLHKIEPRQFEEQLIYLKENQYHTINAEDYYAWLTGKASLPGKSIILAIDDGEASIWQYAYPLLKKYGLCAVVFLIPGYLRDSEQRFFNLQDHWDGKCSLEQVAQRGDGYYGLLYWHEIKTMEASGVIDFQSHSQFHHQVFSQDTIIGFFDRPAIRFFDWVIPKAYESYVMQDRIDEVLGFPVYQHDSIFRSMRRYLDNEELRVKMQEKTRELGGLEFLRQESSAQSVLLQEYQGLRAAHPGEYQSHQACRQEVLDSLRQSREIIEQQLAKPVRHLCYPYSFYCAESMALSEEAGYVSNFIGTYGGKRCNSPGADPFFTVRLKSDFLPTLPGRGRSSLGQVLWNKFGHRLKGKKVG